MPIRRTLISLKSGIRLDSTITGRLSVHTAFSSSPEYLQMVREWADKLQAGIQMHIAQTTYEVEFIKKHHGHTGSVFFLDDLGFLGPDVIAAHCIYVSDREIEILKDKDVKISYNVKSNLNAANGVAPVPKFIEAGLTVGLGLDGINIMDMHEMTHCAYTIRNLSDRTLMPPEMVLKWPPSTGRSFTMEDQIGSLEPGKKTDLIMVDTRNKLHLTPIFNI